MRECSEQYLENMSGGHTVSKFLTGEIEDIDTGNIVEFNDSNVMKKTFSYVNQCMVDGKFSVGGVYAGRFQVSLKDIPTWVGDCDNLRIKYNVVYSGGDTFPSQWFIVDKLSQLNGKLTVTGYDYMTKFDKIMRRAISAENAYSALVVICELCGLQFGNTQEEILAYPNATEFLFIDPADVPTYRDALQQIGTLMCCFATISPDNKLVMKQFDLGYTTEAVRTIPPAKRIQNSTTISGTARMTDVHGVAYDFSGNEVVLGAEEVGEGVLDFGTLFIVARNISAQNDQILQAWRTFAQNVEYCVCSTKIVPDPSWEIGDRVRLTGATLTDSFISKLVYRYAESEEIQCDGETDASANVQSFYLREERRSGTQISKSAMVSIAYTNADDLNISHDDYVLVSIYRFAALETTHVMMNLMLPIVSDADGDVDVKWNINGTDGDEFLGHIERGNNLVTLAQEYEFAKNDIVLMRVYARSQFYETDNRRQQAHIVSIEDYIQNGGTLPTPVIDETDPNFFIGAGQIRSFIWAKGIDAGIRWDGFLFVTDTMLFCPIGEMGVVYNSDSCDCRLYPVRTVAVQDPAYYQWFANEWVKSQAETISIAFTIADQVPRCGEGLYCGMDMGGILL